MSGPTVAIAGATGAVGRTMLSILEERDFPVGRLRLMASARSAGSVVATKWGEVVVEDLAEADPAGIDVALFSAGGTRSKEYAPGFAAAGAVVVDNSSAFRMDPEVPLVVAGVNDAAIGSQQGIVANPNCTTMVLMMAAAPLHRVAGLRAMTATSYQAVGGSGHAGMAELIRQNDFLGKDPDALGNGSWLDPGPEVYPRPIGWNVIPHTGNPAADGYSDEEWKLVFESRKILDVPDLAVEPMCVRVPVMVGHGVAATMQFSRAIDPTEAVEVLRGAPGVALWEDRLPTPLDAAGIDATLVGPVRPTIGTPGGVNLWVVGDNLRKGAALNAVQLAELL